MGHAVEILVFPDTMSRKEMERRRDAWGDMHVDPEEHGGQCKCSGSHIKFTDKIFPDFKSAVEYLDTTFGHYAQTAVRFYDYGTLKENKTMLELKRRIGEVQKRIAQLDAPHYAGVKSTTVKCKSCGSSLATAYCGKTWRNTCPICKAELRPKTALDRLETAKATLNELQKKYRAEELASKQKLKGKAKLCWAVAAEEHC